MEAIMLIAAANILIAIDRLIPPRVNRQPIISVSALYLLRIINLSPVSLGGIYAYRD